MIINKMKKILSLPLVLSLAVSFSACGSNTSAGGSTEIGQPTESIGTETSLTSETSEQSNEDAPSFNETATLVKTVMYDEGGVKITATGLTYKNNSVDLELTIENNSTEDLSFISGSSGYSCNSINGYMVSSGYLNCDVAAGKKANDSISFNYTELIVYGITEIADMEIGFDMVDDDYNDTYSGPIPLQTSAYDTHDYNKDYYPETVTNSAIMNTYKYSLSYFSQDALYDVNGIKLLSSGVMINRDGDPALLLELENTTSDSLYVSTSDIAINGLVICSSTWSSDIINPGKRSIMDLDISSMLDPEYWDVYGIKEIGTIALALRQRDFGGNDLADKTSVEFVISDANATYDATGTEVYNNNGLRIVTKALLEDPSDLSSDMYVLLLAKNNSGKTLTISDDYDSLSVNGVMADYSYYSQSLADGSSAVLEIQLWDSSLEDNNIASVSDIKEVEITFDIREGYDIIDEPTVVMTFE